MLTNEVLALVLASAGLNAAWNTLLKISGDKMVGMAVTTLVGSGLSLLALPWVGAVAAEGLPLLAASIAIHTAYHFALPVAYSHGDLGQVHPITRGSAPLLVTLGGAALAQEWPGRFELLGSVLLSMGVLSLARSRSGTTSGKGIGYALVAGLLVATYTVVDSLGARKSAAPLAFAVWLTLGDGLATMLIALGIRGPRAFRLDARTLRLCVGAGTLQIGAYWLAVLALAQAPMGPVSALRESSVLMVSLISAYMLRERLGTRQRLAAVLVFAGIGVIRFGPGLLGH